MFFLLRTLLIGISAALMLRCGIGPVAGGAGGETTNGFTAAIYYADGTPAKNVTITARPAHYLSSIPSLAKSAVAVRDVSTDSTGHFVVDSLDTGTYIIECNDDSSGATQLTGVLTVRGGRVTDLGNATLRPYANIQGTIDYAVQSNAKLYVQIYGLERLIPVGADGRFAAESLPAGTFNIRFISLDSVAQPAVDIANLAVSAGQTRTVNQTNIFKDSVRITINTTALTALTQPVYRFPLLVRLKSSDIVFANTAAGGRDIRFYKSNGTAMPFEIEQWDSIAQSAAIWVRCDTILPSNASQYIVMRYNNRNAVSIASGKAVFDTANGFIGVWHMGQAGTALRPNSAQTAFAAQPVNYSGHERVAGVAGMCDNLDSLDHDSIGAINTPTITLSTWVNPAQLNAWDRIITRPDTGLPFYHSYALVMDSSGRNAQGVISVNDGPATVEAATALSIGSWTHLCITYDGFWFIEYQNGVAQDTVVSTGQLHSNNNPVFIAWESSYPGHQKFVGKIDEVRIERSARSAEWIALSYENQKPLSALITIAR